MYNSVFNNKKTNNYDYINYYSSNRSYGQAAKFIGMPYPTFYYYVKKHSIKGVVLDRTSERKLARINDYCKLRKSGTILADAAKAIGVSMQTAYAYEVIFNNKK